MCGEDAVPGVAGTGLMGYSDAFLAEEGCDDSVSAGLTFLECVYDERLFLRTYEAVGE